MAVTIDATVGGASANSYVTLAEMTTYMTGRLNSATFDDAATDDQNRALVEATREVDIKTYQGNRADSTQILAWPRQWARNVDSPTLDYFATNVIPERVKDATMELAFQFLEAGSTDIAMPDSSDGVIEKTIDVLTTRYASPWARLKGLKRYPRAYDRLAPLLALRGNEVVRG